MILYLLLVQKDYLKEEFVIDTLQEMRYYQS